MRRVARQIRSWANLTVLEDYTLLMWRRQMLELDFDFALTIILSISLYSLIASGVREEFWWFSRALSLGIRFCFLVICWSLRMYLF